MKHVSIFALAAFGAVASFGAHAAPISNLHSNGVITNNIANMQHSIMLNVTDNFGSVSKMGQYKDITATESRDPHEKCPPVYGEMRPYGEENDDGNANKTGRSGGDEIASQYSWFDWKHSQDKAEFKDYDNKVNSRYDLISLGFANDPERINGGYSQFGGFGGLILGNEKSEDIKISELGGFLGLFKGYHINGFNIIAAGDLGALFSDSKSTPGEYDFTNFWLGAGLNASYDIKLADSFTLQPGVYGGYTWIYSKGYEEATGSNLSVDGLHKFEVAPALRAITRLGGGWYGTLSGRYVFNFAHGGNATIAGADIPELELKDYVEYGIGIERNVDRFGFSVSVNRHDGGLTGWMGELQLRYIF